MNKKALFACAMLWTAPWLGVQALETPKRSQEDHRIQYVNYSEDNVVRINAANGCITTVIFSPSEQVVNYGSGYSTAWEFATADNRFFLKPKDKDGTTNIVVVTNKRVYAFDVYLVEKPANATYKLTFRYPKEYLEAQIAAGQEAYVNKRLESADPHLNPQGKNGLNYHYTMNFGESAGSKELAPVQVYDNGRFTYMKFKEHSEFPAIYSVSSDGEAIINTHIEDQTLVIHGVYAEYRLRAGSDVVGIYNEGFNTTFAGPNEGTTVQGLVREINKEQQ